MFETLTRLYLGGKLDAEGLEKAVKKGWITEDQMQEIIGGNE